MQKEWLGLTDYEEALKLQSQVKNMVLGLEHPVTITMGRRADPLKDVKVGFLELKKHNIPIVAIDRGGQATLHSPGQLVIYPIVNLEEMDIGVRQFVELLENTTMDFMSRYNIKVERKEGAPGLYTEKGKIVFIGLRVKNHMVSHGLAINVYNELDLFGMIRSCGNPTEAFDRMIDHGVNAPPKSLFFDWFDCLKDNLNRL